MRYMLLIYSDETRESEMSPAELTAMLEAYGKFSEEVRRRGELIAAEPLQPTATATTIRVRQGKALTTDGPFAETKEQLGGFYLIDCKDLDEAIELAAMVPTAQHGSIEIRPIMDFAGVTG
jgi:hypothetical protein